MGVRVGIRVTPRSGRECVEAGLGGDLLVRVTVPPEGGKANAAVCRLVAKALGVPKTAVRVVRGEKAREKLLEIDGDGDAVTAALRSVIRGGECS